MQLLCPSSLDDLIKSNLMLSLCSIRASISEMEQRPRAMNSRAKLVLPPFLLQGKSSSASSGSNIVKLTAAILGLSSLSKNLANFHCMSRTPTSYDAQHCEKIRKRMASCLESVRRRVQRQNERWESLQKEATAAGFANIEDYINHKRDTDPRKCRIAYEKYKKCLSEDENNRFCQFYINNCL
ncbi:hypothetical protein ACSBR2_007020 [Camellia fascicularis]